MVSTFNAPDVLFEEIERESEKTCFYKRLFLDYNLKSLFDGHANLVTRLSSVDWSLPE